MRSQRIELIFGMLGGVLGLVALVVYLYVPSNMLCYTVTHSTPIPPGCFRISQVQEQGLANLWFPIALLGGLSLGIAVFALWHSLSRNLLALVLLWVWTAVLWGVTLVALLSVGVLFVPADLLALVASIAGTVAAGQRAAAPV